MAIPKDFTAASVQGANASGTAASRTKESPEGLGGRDLAERLGSPFRDTLRRGIEEGLIRDLSLFSGGASNERPTSGSAEGFRLVDPAEIDLRSSVADDPFNERSLQRVGSLPDSTLKIGGRNPYSGIRCSEYARPGQIAFVFGSDPDRAVGVIFEAEKAMNEILAKFAEYVLAKAFGPALTAMTETERVFYDLAAGEYSSAQMDNFLRRAGFEPGPGRCYVITPDMPDGKWVRELK